MNSGSGPTLARHGFVHIPKNAGTSITRAIAESGLPIPVSDHFYTERLAVEEIVVLRSPLDRFASAFNYGRAFWRNPVNDAFADANDLAECAADPEHPRHALAIVEMGNEPEHFLRRNGKPTLRHAIAGRPTRHCFVYEPQSSWLINQPAHILGYRRLSEEFPRLLSALGYPAIDPLPRLNQSRDDKMKFSSRALGYLQSLYAADFDVIREHGLDA